ncbi:hypothetical protein [Sphingobium sp. KCTC 72723]|uniref:hypothetical protein n=1 Tax=Sphingobium sp. KCTC 72723 TaxID=2733867 RepID=UPI00165E7C1F|nr:hypothetical protein [Sphingobium sp. KCTC 72723]
MTTPTLLRPQYKPFDVDAWRRENDAPDPAIKLAPAHASANYSDLIYGLEAIADFVGLTVAQVKHQISISGWPTFKQGRTVCALRSALAEHFAEQTRLAMQNRKGG